MNILDRAKLLPESSWALLGKENYLPQFFNDVLGCGDYFDLDWQEQVNFPLDFVWVNVHLCTDTQVGKRIYRYKGQVFLVTNQSARKSDETPYVVNKNVLKQCVKDFRELAGEKEEGWDEEIDSSHLILQSFGYFQVNYSSEIMSNSAYYLSKDVERDTDNLVPCHVVRKGFDLEGYRDGCEIVITKQGNSLQVSVKDLFFKEFGKYET